MRTVCNKIPKVRSGPLHTEQNIRDKTTHFLCSRYTDTDIDWTKILYPSQLRHAKDTSQSPLLLCCCHFSSLHIIWITWFIYFLTQNVDSNIFINSLTILIQCTVKHPLEIAIGHRCWTVLLLLGYWTRESWNLHVKNLIEAPTKFCVF